METGWLTGTSMFCGLTSCVHPLLRRLLTLWCVLMRSCCMRGFLFVWFFVSVFLFLAVPDPYRFERDLGDD